MITPAQKLSALDDSIKAQRSMIELANYHGFYEEVNARKVHIDVLQSLQNDIKKTQETTKQNINVKSFNCPWHIISRIHAAEKLSDLSPDIFVKHGCIIFDKEGTAISMGINMPPVGFDTQKIDQTNKIERKPFNEHAERAAIFEAARRGISLEGSYFYITGQPCPECLRAIISTGASCVIFGDRKSNSSAEHAIINQKILAALQEDYPFSMFAYHPAHNTLTELTKIKA